MVLRTWFLSILYICISLILKADSDLLINDYHGFTKKSLNSYSELNVLNFSNNGSIYLVPDTIQKNDSTETSEVDGEEKGFIKKLFSSATKEEKETKDLINRASRAGCRIEVTFKCQDTNAIEALLNNSKQQAVCINYLTNQLDKNYKYDGLN